jgi:hypothetical protein
MKIVSWLALLLDSVPELLYGQCERPDQVRPSSVHSNQVNLTTTPSPPPPHNNMEKVLTT